MSEHPSHLELYRQSLGAGAGATAEHLRTCARCQTEIANLESRPAVPGWARALANEAKPSLAARARKLFSVRLALPLALAACAASILFIVRAPAPSPEITAKGAPAIAIYFKRDGRISLWDGRERLRAGDALQLKLQPESFTHEVLGSIDGDGLHVLHEADLSPRGATLLPLSLTLDGKQTTLLVLFSRAPIPASELGRLSRELPRTSSTWSIRIDIAGEKR